MRAVRYVWVTRGGKRGRIYLADGLLEPVWQHVPYGCLCLRSHLGLLELLGQLRPVAVDILLEEQSAHLPQGEGAVGIQRQLGQKYPVFCWIVFNKDSGNERFNQTR